jgi:hypothetical protein
MSGDASRPPAGRKLLERKLAPGFPPLSIRHHEARTRALALATGFVLLTMLAGVTRTMKKTLGIIFLTAVATNLIWFAVIGCLMFFATKTTTQTGMTLPTVDNNFVVMVMRDLTTQNFTFTFRETGRTATNFVATNQILLQRPLHHGQEFTIVVQDPKESEP